MVAARRLGQSNTHEAKRIVPMLRYALWGLIGLFANPALGQQAPQPEWRAAPSPSPNSLQPLKGSMTWEEPMPGDHWIFETRDEITGEISTQSNLLTELSPAGIRVQINIVRSDNANNGTLLLYDRSWFFMTDPGNCCALDLGSSFPTTAVPKYKRRSRSANPGRFNSRPFMMVVSLGIDRALQGSSARKQ